MHYPLHPRPSPGGHLLPLLPLVVLGALLAGCRDAGLAPVLDGPRFTHAPGHGLKGAIAFHSSRDGDFEIFVMNADGSQVTQLTHNDVHEFDPIWSPNGRQIAFGRCFPDRCQVVVINADGSGEQVLIDNGFPGAWSPNGQRIAFGREGEVYVMNVDGSGVTQLTQGGGFPTGWSPNGKQILFISFRDDNLDIYVMHADGSGVVRLTDDPALDFGDRAGWSPDGKRILFSSTRDGGDIDLFVMNADGSDVTQLTFNDGIDDDDPVWSPDGKHIAFHSTADGDEEIVVINADGTGRTQLTFNTTLPDGTPIFDAVPAWRARPLH